MITPGSANALLLSQSGYSVPYSLRFRRANNAAMTRTAGTPTNAKIATWSFWHKRGALGPEWVWGESTGGASTFFTFDSSAPDTIRIQVRGANLTSTPVFRDPSAWYHFVVAVDTTQATAADRIKVYVNNQAVTMSGTITLNADITFNESGKSIKISNGAGWFATSADYIDGYLAEFNFIDGQALTPSSFGQTDSATGVWVPKKYSGTYGNNGFYLKFADASAATAAAIGKDSSGNGNNWTPSGISVTSGVTFDQMLDTPTLNYAVLSPLDKSSVVTFQYSTLGITGGSAGGGDTFSQTAMTFGLPTTGKWYLEFKRDTAGSDANGIGVNITRTNRGGNGWPATRGISGYTGYYAFEYGFNITHDVASNNLTYRNNNVALNTYSTASTASSAIYGFAVDCDSSLVYMYENGVLLTASGGLSFTHPGGQAVIALFKSDLVASINCGQRSFSYTPPTGFKALNTANLPTPSIKKGSLYMDATLRTGTGATASVSTLGFQPDFVWIKSRSNATAHNLFNSVIGATKGIQSTGPNAQYTDANSLTAFNANGYSLGSDASSRGVNINTNTYVDWAWKESTTAGLDILSWTGDGTGARTINHALGVTPEFMMLRGTDARARACWFNSMTSVAYYMDLGTYAAEAIDTTMFDSTAPTSTTFRVGSYNNVNAVTYVGYFFSSIAGFSNIGSYTGNASADGPFVFCGFRPRLVIIKDVTSANLGWRLYDSVRETYNEMGGGLEAASTAAESYATSVRALDFLSNGFKIRVSASGLNGSGVKYAFIAFAENSFKYARAR